MQRSQGRRTTNLSFEAPICEVCEAYAATIHKASKKRAWGVFIGSFVVGLPLALLLFGTREIGVSLLLWSFGSLMIVAIVMSMSGLSKRLDRRMAGEPPEAYASSNWLPCEMTSARSLRFYSSAYQEQFAALNSGLVR